MSTPKFFDGYLPPAGRLVPGTPPPRRPLPATPDKYAVLYPRDYDVPTDERSYTPRLAERTSYTNHLTQSDNFAHADWTKTNLTITSDYAARPWDGSVAADRLLETVTNAEHRVSQAFVFTAVSHVLWAVVKDIGRGYLRLLANDGATDFKAFYDLTAGTVISTAGGATAGVTVLKDGWRLVWLKFTPAAAAGNVYANTSTDGATVAFAGDVAKGIALANLQLERATAPGALVITTTAAGTASVPDLDPVDPFAYLIAETDPEFITSDLSRVRRTFARVPAAQTVEESIMVTRPDPGLAAYPGPLGNFRVFQPDTTLKKFDVYAKQDVTSDTGAPTFYPTGGTYTLTVGGYTTGALNYNDAAATVQTALNALTSVSNRGNVVVGGSYNSAGGLTVTFNNYAAATMDGSALTGAIPPAYGVNLLNGGYTQTLSIGPTGAYGSNFTGGTFTITIFGQTTAAIAYNATPAAVQAALNALSEVANRGNCTITTPYGSGSILGDGGNGYFGIRFTINFANAAFTADASSLTVAPCTVTPSITDGAVGRTQKIVFTGGQATRDLYVSGGHGLAAADVLYVRSGANYYSGISGAKFTLPDANTVRLVLTAADAYAAAGTITEVGKRTKLGYEPGSDPKQVTIVTRFSLSAITPDTYQGSDATLLQEIFGGNTAINLRVGDSARWPFPESPIRTLTTTKVSSAIL